VKERYCCREKEETMKDTANAPDPKYRVLIDDNFWFDEEEERHEHGSYNTLEEAVAVAKRIVDDFLVANHKPGMTAVELYDYSPTRRA
jgi:hypothetical protein